MKKFKTFLLIAIFINTQNTLLFAQQKNIGIWFSTWYANKGNYIWASEDFWSKGTVGKNCSNQFLGDVNGDGKADAVTYYGNNGQWFVALSNGSHFEVNTSWMIGHGVGSNYQFLADVTGDGKEDAIIVFSQSNKTSIYISISNGNQFLNYSLWKEIPISFSNLFFADVSGDNKADFVGYTASTGNWFVMKSNGNNFDNGLNWITGHGVGANEQFLSDVNGDGKKDAVVFFTSTGSCYVSISNGTYFNNYSMWGTGIAKNESKILFEDANNDNNADLIYLKNGTWFYYLSILNSSGFSKEPVQWKTFHGDNLSIPFVKKIDGQSQSAIIFNKTTGNWKALPSAAYYSQPNIYNTWQAWDIRYRPVISAELTQYDSGDNSIIDYQLEQITQAKIDYLIFDLTNNIYTDNAYIFERAVQVAKRIQIWNSYPSHLHIKYAVAIGGVNLTVIKNPQIIENECKIVYDQFVNQPFGMNNYFNYLGKPLIINYTSTEVRDTFASWKGDKSFWNKFNSLEAEGPGKKDYVGWYTPDDGAINSSNIMFVNPGHNNRKDHNRSRENGSFYLTNNYQRVIANKPKMLVIASYNEFAEENAVSPANTDFVIGATEKWPNPNFYWDITTQKNAIYLSLPLNNAIKPINNLIEINGTTAIIPTMVRNVFSIRTSDQVKTVLLYSSEGKLVCTFTPAPQYNIENYKSGIYTIHIKTNKASVSGKIIKL